MDDISLVPRLSPRARTKNRSDEKLGGAWERGKDDMVRPYCIIYVGTYRNRHAAHIIVKFGSLNSVYEVGYFTPHLLWYCP